jgi:acetyl-CoA carboxylase biotin carboxyl carrier protein
MEPEKVKELIEMMKVNDLSEMEIVDGQTRIVLKRGPTHAPAPLVAMTPALTTNGVTRPAASAPSDTAVEPIDTQAENLTEITSPIVGTFFAAPSPNADPFVREDTQVEPESVVCVIEAMKVMNEIKSGFKGTIKKILVKNGTSVEYGQPMFLVERN